MDCSLPGSSIQGIFQARVLELLPATAIATTDQLFIGCILAWIIPWTGESGRLQSMWSQRVRHNWSNWACIIWFQHFSNSNFNISISIISLSPYKIELCLFTKKLGRDLSLHVTLHHVAPHTASHIGAGVWAASTWGPIPAWCPSVCKYLKMLVDFLSQSPGYMGFQGCRAEWISISQKHAHVAVPLWPPASLLLNLGCTGCVLDINPGGEYHYHLQACPGSSMREISVIYQWLPAPAEGGKSDEIEIWWKATSPHSAPELWMHLNPEEWNYRGTLTLCRQVTSPLVTPVFFVQRKEGTLSHVHFLC